VDGRDMDRMHDP